jgi:putative ATPase
MKQLGYGKGYKYAHHYGDAYVSQEYLPKSLRGQRFYRPSQRGFEKTIDQRLNKWLKKKQAMTIKSKEDDNPVGGPDE